MPSVQDLTQIFVCPSCRGETRADGQGLACSRCSTRGRLFGPTFVDFLGGDEAHARTILGWRDDLIPAMEDAVVQVRAQSEQGKGIELSAESMALLREFGLLDANGQLTPLGGKAAYNSSEFRWQSQYDPLEGMAPVPELALETRVLDLGGGSGQTLRRLFPNPVGTVVCLDADLDILAYGAKLFSAHGLNALFCRASSHQLPMRDGYFDHIICRTMLNYTHQRRTLTEAVRVLRPGGWLFLRVENLNWDLNVLGRTRGLVNLIFGVRVLFWGLFHAATGYQPAPGTKLAGYRAYVSPRRVRKILRGLDVQLERFEPSRRGPQYRGRGTQDVALCVRKPAAAAPVN